MTATFRAFVYGRRAPLFEQVIDTAELENPGAFERLVLEHAAELEAPP